MRIIRAYEGIFITSGSRVLARHQYSTTRREASGKRAKNAARSLARLTGVQVATEEPRDIFLTRVTPSSDGCFNYEKA